MNKTKYNIQFSRKVVQENKKRLINQLWKVLPMRENGEDWEKQLKTVEYEIIGLSEIFIEQTDFLILLSKIEAIFYTKDFNDFRKMIFESINLLGIILNEYE